MHGRHVAQGDEGVEWDGWYPEGRWFDPRLLLAECRGVPERHASPCLLPTSWLSPGVADTAVGVWMFGCLDEWVNECMNG